MYVAWLMNVMDRKLNNPYTCTGTRWLAPQIGEGGGRGGWVPYRDHENDADKRTLEVGSAVVAQMLYDKP